MPRDDRTTTVRVGALVLGAVLALGFGVFLLGEQNNLFRSMNEYTVELESVAGLQAGNPVQLDGVDVGRVGEIILPRDPGDEKLVVEIQVDSRYAQRIRKDSMARIKTLGLLGDKYIDLTSGSADAVVIEDGGLIPAAPATNVDRLIASGEDAVENIVAISVSLSKILTRLEAGEGVLGQLMAPLPEDYEGPPITQSLLGTMATVDRIALQIDTSLETGQGPLPRLLHDEAMGRRLAGSIERLDRLTQQLEDGEGLVPGLLTDTAMRERFETTLAHLETTSGSLARLSAELDEADGLLPRLLYDEAYAAEITGELDQLLERLNQVAGDLAEGDGTAGQLIRDPAVYEAVQDVLVGINESRMLRWLIRNRQRKGIEVRYEAAQTEPGAPTEDGAGDATQNP
ncbi:MAG: MlaD family protein [Acidobacteriota bacterium]